jgi:phage terminase small subunit
MSEGSNKEETRHTNVIPPRQNATVEVSDILNSNTPQPSSNSTDAVNIEQIEIIPVSNERVHASTDVEIVRKSVIEDIKPKSSFMAENMLEENDLTVQQVQRLLKQEGKKIDSYLLELQEKIAKLKKDLILDAKQNWVLARHIETTSDKIRLLIKNQLKSEVR